MKQFKPILASNELMDVHDLPYPLLASFKIDGIRGLVTKGKILSRSLKPIPSKQIQEKFSRLTGIEEGCYLDGEFYNPKIPFQMVQSCIMTQDYEAKKAIKKWADLCEDYDVNVSREEALKGMKLYAFDRVHVNIPNEPFKGRNAWVVETYYNHFPNLIEPVKQKLVNNAEEAKAYFYEALEWGCDGLILRDPNGRYKFGRGTLKEGLIFKLKPYTTFDAKIIDVVQATKVDPNTEKKINELGNSVTSKKKGDRIFIEKACDFVVMHEGEKRLKVMIAMTDKQKKEVWKNREEYIGRWIEYKGLMVGAKDLPRHPVFLRMRDDKE